MLVRIQLMPWFFTPSPGRYVPDDPLDEGLTVVRVGKGYDTMAKKGKGRTFCAHGASDLRS